MSSSKRRAAWRSLRLILPALCCSAVAWSQAPRGQDAYAKACANCHGATLDGTQFGPALKGATFAAQWRDQPRAAFTEKLRTTMPPGKLGSIPADTYADIEAYITAVNAASGANSERQAGGMMGPMQRRADDPQYLAALKTRKNVLDSMSTITDATLQHPAPGDWVMWRRTYDALGYSPLHQIDRSNIRNLRMAWSWSLPQSSNELTPLIHDGVLFVASGGAVQALDAASGDLLWQYQRSIPAGAGFGASHGKSLAIYGDLLFAISADAHVVALDIRTGHLVWDQEVVPAGAAGGGLGLNSAPMVVKGTVIVGVSTGIAYAGGCFIVGLDAKTGKEQWRFHTVARPGQPGGDSWNGAPVEERFGGGVWMGGSYDPQLDLVYFGIGNTYDTATLLQPRPGATGLSANDGLYTDSSVALHPQSGSLAWYYQHQKRDIWDLDWVFEQSLLTLPVNGQPREVIVTGGKTALFDVLDARTGAFVFAKDLGVQNVVSGVDPRSGEKTINPAVQPEAGKTKIICPNSIGARNWQATAINPDSGVLYVPILENCADFTYTPSSAAQTAKGGIDIHFSARTPSDHDGNFGRLVALNLKTHEILWTHRQRMPLASAVLATAGGLLFVADVDRNFYAYDQANGTILWRTRLNAAGESFPVTYSVNGRQYIAVIAGSGSPMGAASRAFVPEVAASAAGVTLTVFEMP
ncbi:MAG TPA: PQQ-binding-like beta-propeller repeat protein [Steroidobacteraceae bacterium]|nr:PQQ-binding-like beta-propeller repeat protein [Steroidobacteraceae bacterium]